MTTHPVNRAQTEAIVLIAEFIAHGLNAQTLRFDREVPLTDCVRTVDLHNAFLSYLDTHHPTRSSPPLKSLTRKLQAPPFNWVKRDSAGARWQHVVMMNEAIADLNADGALTP